MRLFLVRHGQTDWNLNGIIQGATDIELNEIGISQAHEASEQLKDVKFDYCFASSLKRAIKTAQIICPIEPIIDNRLIERGMGDLEGKSRDLYDNKLYWDYRLNSNLYGVEPVQDLFARSENFLNDLKEKYPDKTILVVSHSATVRALNYIIKGYNADTNFFKTKISNCCVLEYNI